MLELHKIIPAPRNTNQHPPEQIDLLAKIIDYQGVRWPIIISNRSGFIVAGHGRLLAAQKLGLENYPVNYQDFESEAQEYEFLESDNRLAELAEHDREKMILNIKDIPEINLDMIGIPDLSLDFYNPMAPGSNTIAVDGGSTQGPSDPSNTRGPTQSEQLQGYLDNDIRVMQFAFQVDIYDKVFSMLAACADGLSVDKNPDILIKLMENYLEREIGSWST